VIEAVAAIMTVGSLWATPSPDMDTAARPADLPATDTLSVCPGTPKLPKGSDDDADLEFSAESSDAVSALTVTAASDLAGNIPGFKYYETKAVPDKKT